MYINQEIGKIGEEIATRYLEKNGYYIIENNFNCKQGEIDIICSNEKYLIFVEVKTRSNICYGKPAEAVNNAKQKHMYASAKYYLHIHKLEKSFVRFDVIEVYLSKNKARINHIKQVI